jgi:hypothetical protein
MGWMLGVKSWIGNNSRGETYIQEPIPQAVLVYQALTLPFNKCARILDFLMLPALIMRTKNAFEPIYERKQTE